MGSINFKHLFNIGEKISDEPFILASQAIQVYYVPDVVDNDWADVVHSKPSDVYDLDNVEGELMENDNGLLWSLHDLNANVIMDIVNGVVPSVRTNIDGTIVDPKRLRKSLESKCCLNDFAAVIM